MTNGLGTAAPVPPPRSAPSVRRGLAAAVCLPLALASPSRGDGLAPPEGEAWRQLRMERLVVCGNATEAKLRDVAASFGRLRAVLASLSPEGRARSPVPTVIVVFRDDHELQRFGLRADGRPIRASGFFRAGPDANQIGLSASWNEDPRPVVYHELLHEHVRWNLPPLPVWFEEGLAEYYSTFTASGSQATVGGIQREHLRLLRRSVPMPLEELLAVGKDSPWYTESSRRGPFYAEAWAFTHFLLHSDPTLAPRLFRYLGRTREGARRREAFLEAFGRDEVAVFADFVAYVRGPRFTSYTIPLPAGSPEPPRAEAVPRPDVLTRLAGLLLPDATRDADAAGLLAAALALRPDHPAALAGQARLAARAGRKDEELALLRRAAEAPDAPAGVDYGLGAALLVRSGHEESAEARHATVEEGRRSLERALGKDPAFTPARVLLGRSFLIESGPGAAPGVAFLEAARAEGASDPQLLADLDELRRRANGPPAHRGLPAPAPAPGGSAPARVASESDAVNRLLAEGREGEALARLETLRDSLEKEPGLRAAVEEDLGRVRALAAHNALVKKYNEGLLLAKEGHLEAALKAFQEVASGSTAAGLAASAREMAAEIRKAMPATGAKRSR